MNKFRQIEIKRRLSGLKQKVLVIDDDIYSVQILLHVLQQFGCNVQVSQNAINAVDRLVKDDFDLIILDWMMPKLNGNETLLAPATYWRCGRIWAIRTPYPLCILACLRIVWTFLIALTLITSSIFKTTALCQFKERNIFAALQSIKLFFLLPRTVPLSPGIFLISNCF